MLSDAQRHDLYTAALNSWGLGPAEALMSLVPPAGWDDLARRSDITEVRGEMAEVRGEMAELRGEMGEVRGEMAELRGEMAEVRGEMAEVRGEMAELRGEIALLRTHVDAQLPRLIAANIASMIGVAGLVLAAASLVS